MGRHDSQRFAKPASRGSSRTGIVTVRIVLRRDSVKGGASKLSHSLSKVHNLKTLVAQYRNLCLQENEIIRFGRQEKVLLRENLLMHDALS